MCSRTKSGFEGQMRYRSAYTLSRFYTFIFFQTKNKTKNSGEGVLVIAANKFNGLITNNNV